MFKVKDYRLLKQPLWALGQAPSLMHQQMGSLHRKNPGLLLEPLHGCSLDIFSCSAVSCWGGKHADRLHFDNGHILDP
jgi:hypothetical protein